MTLGELIEFLAQNPYYPVFYFIALPLAAFLALRLGKGEGHLSPWCNFYTVLIYLAVIPGVFALLLNLYHMLFENISIYEANIMTQFLPIVSMLLTLFLIKKNVNFDDIPGFGKITGFVSMMAGIMVIFFILNKMRLLVFTYVPFIWVVILLVAVFLMVRFGTKSIFKDNKVEGKEEV